ncbi:protein kinase [Moorena sp. SIO2C4]|uniref:protein kinase domain-containing protein n=1 Tax=Moorena sp. SIO2C4 TaxID=2607824 RepID=UPI0013CBA991|nr:protein kinase [Moorena sp. SIO2C4]NES42561.1 protein kinase [Moorena sp. SIO2C4]
MNSIICMKCEQINPSRASFCSRCGASLPPPSSSPLETNLDNTNNDNTLDNTLDNTNNDNTLQTGSRLRDRYIIQRTLGQGGFGKTYLAKDTGRFNELVTLKELTPRNQGTHTLEKAEELFQREATMLHKLSSPQIPRFWEFFRHGKRLFLVQDYIEGKTYQTLLEERVSKGERFSETEIIQLFQQLLPVLSYLHQLGIIHRDIAPDNIIRRASDGVPVLIDLGGVKQIALEVNTPVTRGALDLGEFNSPRSSAPGQNSAIYAGGTCLGKVGYAPDEQLRLGIAAPHSDLYALGVTSLVLMTGKQPQELVDPYTLSWRTEEEVTLSPEFNSILSRLLASQPSERFQSAQEVLDLIRTDDSDDSKVRQTEIKGNVAVTPQSKSYPPPTPINNSGCKQVFDESVLVPAEIQGWNWGAFCLPGLWCVTNQVWIGLIAWTDLSLVTGFLAWPVMGIILGIKGNEWAWKSRRWKSIKAFKRHQRGWAITSFVIIGIIVTLLFLLLLVFFIGVTSLVPW